MTDSTCSTDVYKENLEFWQRAWAMVKSPYKQLPDLDYIPRIAACLQARMDGRVLDLGCGSGWLSVFLARHGFDVVGVDVSAHAIELGKTWAKDESLGIEFQCQDITKLNFPEKYFKSIVANSIFEHLSLDLAEKTIALSSRILATGGLFVACFDIVGTGPGEYYSLADGTHVYTDKARQGMILRCYSDFELRELFKDWKLHELSTLASGSRFLIAECLD